jgi:hypothetical protein
MITATSILAVAVRSSDAMAVQKDHDLADDLLFGPAFSDPPSSNLANSGDYRGVANDSDQFAVASCLYAKNAKTVFGVVVSDALDKAGKNFLGRRF